MKNLILFWILLFTLNVLAQENKPEMPEAPYDVINLKFVIEGSPNAEEVGFNNPKSTWEFKYELRFLHEMGQLGEKSDYKPTDLSQNQTETPKERELRVRKNNKNYAKAWKKAGIRLVKGRISRSQLIEAKNREITIPVKLTPEIMEVLAKASVNWDNPAFRLKVSGKISLQTEDNLNFRRKFGPDWTCLTKWIDRKENKQLWMINTCGASIEIKKEDGKIVFGLSSKIQ